MAHNDSHVDQLYADGFQVGFSQICTLRKSFVSALLAVFCEEKLEDQDQKMANGPSIPKSHNEILKEKKNYERHKKILNEETFC